MMKKLLTILLVGSIGLLLVEVMVLGLGTRTSIVLVLMSLVNVLISLGLWGLSTASRAAGSASGVAKVIPLGVLLTSLGLLVLAAPPWPVARSWDLELTQVIRDSSLFSGALIAATLGLVVLGIGHFHHVSVPRWTALVLIVCSPIAMLITLNSGPLLVANLAGLLVALALVAMTMRLGVHGSSRPSVAA